MMDFNQILAEAIEKYVETILQDRLVAVANRLNTMEKDNNDLANQIYDLKHDVLDNAVTEALGEYDFSAHISGALDDFDIVRRSVEDYLSQRTFNLVRNN